MTTTKTDREVADALWRAMAELGARDMIGGMQNRRELLGQENSLDDDTDTEGPNSRVTEYAGAPGAGP
jgi:hypothetical protein